MYRLRTESCLLLGAALLAGCSERNTPTSPPAQPLAAASGADHSTYTWSLACSGNSGSSASWYWTDKYGTRIGDMSESCVPSSSPISASGVPRPADATGFSACVNGDGVYNGACSTWTVVPGSAFSAQLKGTATFKYPFCSKHHCGGQWDVKMTATLNVDS